MGNILDLSQVWRYVIDKNASVRNTSSGEPTSPTGGMQSSLARKGNGSKANYSQTNTGTGTKAGSATSKQERSAKDRGSSSDSGGVDSTSNTDKPENPANNGSCGGGTASPSTGGGGGGGGGGGDNFIPI